VWCSTSYDFREASCAVESWMLPAKRPGSCRRLERCTNSSSRQHLKHNIKAHPSNNPAVKPMMETNAVAAPGSAAHL
jgi:hypothetical protein